MLSWNETNKKKIFTTKIGIQNRKQLIAVVEPVFVNSNTIMALNDLLSKELKSRFKVLIYGNNTQFKKENCIRKAILALHYLF